MLPESGNRIPGSESGITYWIDTSRAVPRAYMMTLETPSSPATYVAALTIADMALGVLSSLILQAA